MRMKLKMRFSEFVRRYSNYKYKETGIRHITESERKNLIKEFNKISEKKIDSQKKRVNEGTSEKRMSRYAEMRRGKRSNGKYSEMVGNGRKTGKEIKELREAFEANFLNNRKPEKFSEMVSSYKDFKEHETGDRSVSYREIKELREAFEANFLKKKRQESKRPEKFSEMVSSYKNYKERKTGNRSVSYAEIKELREAFEANSLNSGRRGQKRITEKKLDSIRKKLHEASFHVRRANRLLKENDMAGAEMAVDNAANAVDAVNDMTAGANVPPEVQTQIQSVMAAVEQLANVAGLATQNDMNGNVDANVPPAEGMGVVDENSTMFERAMLRRSTLLEEINIPQAKKVAAGVSKYSGKTWKPAAIKYSKTGSLTEDSTQREDEKMVDELLNEKTFNYKDLFAKGILG